MLPFSRPDIAPPDGLIVLVRLSLVLGALVCLQAPALPAAPPRAAVLSGLPHHDAGLIEAISGEIAAAGYAVEQIPPETVLSEESLSAAGFDLLVLPNGAVLPGAAAPALESFARKGGDILALNAPLWQQALIRHGGKWTDRDEYQKQAAGQPLEHPVAQFSAEEVKRWERTSNPGERKTLYEAAAQGPARGTSALHVQMSGLDGWETFRSPALEAPFAEGHTLTVFSAKGGPRTSLLSVEWTERDGSRWIAVIPLSREWRRFVLAPRDFRYWTSVPERGGRGDSFKPQNARQLTFGLAFTHTGTLGGDHEYWVGPVGTAKMTPDYQEVVDSFAPPALDTLSPSYKLFDVTGAEALSTRSDQAIAAVAEFPVPAVVRSVHPRPRGGGFAKGRDWRWIPLLEARTGAGEWRGAPAAMTVHASGPCKGGVWTSFGIGDTKWYGEPGALALIRGCAGRMRDGLFILDGGANFYTYFEGQELKLGVRAANVGAMERKGVTLRVSVAAGNAPPVATRTWTVDLLPGETKPVSSAWKPAAWPENGYTVTAEMLDGERVIDRVSHEVHVYRPAKVKHFVKSVNGEFVLNGKRWRAHGVNYMPSSGIGTEDGEYFEHWVGARSYDPEVIRRDLEHVKDLGLNSVSIFIYSGMTEDQNLLDLLRQLRELGLKANLSLRPGTPMDFLWPEISKIIRYYRLWDDDTLFAYDLAWEPMFNTHEDRRIWDAAWEEWIVQRYRSVENAEKDWGVPAVRDSKGALTNPLPHMIDTDGPWRKMTAAYRRFLDTLLYEKYSRARALVRGLDPNHLVSFRMAEAGNPDYRWDGRIPYDFPYLAAAVDIIEPEAYGRIGDWDRVKRGWFEFEYIRWAAPGKPVMWAEMGVSSWDAGAKRTDPGRLEFQAQYFRDFYRMMTASGYDGVFYWWYPGGFRYGENSDYGIINPDGSDRPVSAVIRDNAEAFLSSPPAQAIDSWIEFDRDEHPDGIAGIYDKVKDEFWDAIRRGLTPGLKTGGTATTSETCPALAVGNNDWNGDNPAKYLDGFFDSVEVLDAAGKWVKPVSGGSVTVTARKPVIARLRVTNLGEARWVTQPGHDAPPGSVYIVAESDTYVVNPLPGPLSRHRSATLGNVEIYPAGLKEETKVLITFLADARTRFGQKFWVRLKPK